MVDIRLDDMEVRPTGRPGFRPPLLALALLCLLGMVADTWLAVTRTYLPFDPPLTRAIQSIGFGPLTAWFNAYTWLGGLRQFAAAVVAIGLVFVFNRRATLLMAAGALSGVLYQAMNLLIARPRPDQHLVHVLVQTPGYGYPSGHAAFFTSFSVLLLYCLGSRYLGAAGMTAGWFLVVAIVGGACVSRIYLGVHWPSDVLGGLFLGTGLTAFALSWRRISDPVLEHERATSDS